MALTDLQDDVVVATTSMAARIEVRARPVDGIDVRAAIDNAFAVFSDVDRTCTRFDAMSDLMQANRRGDEWTTVSRRCFDALVEAHLAYRRTLGRFDPRVLDDLVRLGYAESYRRRRPAAQDPEAALRAREPHAEWAPGFRGRTLSVRIGQQPVDLGGIGKGLAVRWASQQLAADGVKAFVVDAGGDVYCAGIPADGPAWRVGVEDPRGGVEPVAVLEVSDAAVATSSVRVRTWQVGDQPVHHLVDPATGRPGGDGLLAVTVVDDDPATAEVWSKVLFLAGRRGIAATAELFRLAALWVTTEGAVASSDRMTPYVGWTATT